MSRLIKERNKIKEQSTNDLELQTLIYQNYLGFKTNIVVENPAQELPEDISR